MNKLKNFIVEQIRSEEDTMKAIPTATITYVRAQARFEAFTRILKQI